MTDSKRPAYNIISDAACSSRRGGDQNGSSHAKGQQNVKASKMCLASGRVHTSIRKLLEEEVRNDGGRLFVEYEGRRFTLGDVNSAVDGLANDLAGRGVQAGDRVGVMLRTHPDHIALFFALLKLGATLVPINPALQGPPLRLLLHTAGLKIAVVESDLEPGVHALLKAAGPDAMLVRGTDQGQFDFTPFWESRDNESPPGNPAGTDVVEILFTSGTTGTPKGVLMTDSMHRASGEACLLLSEVRDGDRLFFWEPLHHVLGTETLILALLRKVSLHVVDRFSASQFWSQVRACGATHVHYVGGVLQMLLAQPPSVQDKEHNVRVVWGGGVTREAWLAFAERFNVKITDGYGLTETSSPCVISVEDVAGSIGKPLPWIDAAIVDDQGTVVPVGSRGEIVVREKVPGVLALGYFNNPEATARLYRGEWLRTGDWGSVDQHANMYYHGRMTDSVRRRGENISAWEVERVVNQFPDIAESALIGVPDEIGDQALKIFVRAEPGKEIDLLQLAGFCRETLPRFQVPRFYESVDQFERTPSQRVKKAALSRNTNDSLDLEKLKE